MKIRNIFLAILCLFFVSGCGYQGFLSQDNTIDYSVLAHNHKVVNIDGCEYIVYSVTRASSGYGFMAHKGNCKNPIHIYNQVK